MASDPTNTGFFGSGYTETGTGTTHAIVLNSGANTTPCVAELSEAEADPTTGDYRKVMYALLEMLYQKFLVVDPVPTKVSMTRVTYEDTVNNELVRTYTVQFRTVATGIEVADEA